MLLFGSINLFLHLVLPYFYQEIINLSTTYKWQSRIFFFKLDFYIYIIIQGHLTDSA